MFITTDSGKKVAPRNSKFTYDVKEEYNSSIYDCILKGTLTGIGKN